MEKDPDFHELKNIIYSLQSTELYIARKNGKEYKHIKKWGK